VISSVLLGQLRISALTMPHLSHLCPIDHSCNGQAFVVTDFETLKIWSNKDQTRRVRERS